MPVDGSFLSNPKYGYDFVVATTQASINSGLAAFLAEGNQPITYLCFLVDTQTGNPQKMVSLDELLEATNGVNPFDIPADAPYDDPRIAPLTTALFCVGIELQIGLPPGVLPKNLPPIVTLGNSADNVGFNLFCSKFTVIQNQPPAGWGQPGSWNVWSQPSGTPWYFTTQVDLVMADLNKELNTPYLNSHPDEKAALLRQLDNLSATAFSLKQLLYDLDNARMQSLPKIAGIPSDSNAAIVLLKSFTNVYSGLAKERGWPLLAVTATETSQSPDPSSLHMTAFERQVSLLKDNNGVPIENPTAAQTDATTLDHLCAANGHPLPGTSSFSWNWVLPTEVDQESGVISVNRASIADFFIPQILPIATKSCLLCVPTAVAHKLSIQGEVHIDITPNQRPKKVETTSSGSTVIHIEFTDSKKSQNWSGASYCGVAVSPSYTCDVSFVNTTIQVVQRVAINLWICFDNTAQSINAYDQTLTDTYTISVSQSGGLQVVQSSSIPRDDSEDPNASGFVNFFTGINDVLNSMKKQFHDITMMKLNSIPFGQLQAFVFPGSKTFTYQSADFSNYQDLVCAIRYVDPSQARRKLRDVQARSGTFHADASPRLTLTSSSQMMQNYAHGELMSPTERFEALQTADGHALLFTIDTSGVFRVIEEESGRASTGWAVTDLSSALIAAHFPGASNAEVDTFDVGQSALDGTIGLALAVSDGTTDWLFVSLGNSSSDTAWTAKPSWTRVNFDAVTENPPGINIVGVMFAETTGAGQYLMADIDRLGSSTKNIARYHVDPSKSTGRYWVKQDVPVDIMNGNYQSCVGQVKGGYVDGIYTAGQAGTAAQLVYTPIENVFGSGPPLPRRLGLPGGVIPTAIATARYTDPVSEFYSLTELFAIGGSTLYRFAPDAQQDSAIGKPIVTSDTLSNTVQMYAMTLGGVTTIWGKNASNVVYYVACPTSQLDQPGSWSAVVPILTSIERISPYINRADGGNTILAGGGGKLFRLTQASRTNAKVWRSQEITIAAPPDLPPLSFNSYTTTLVATDADDLPVKALEVEISTDSATPLYINGLYYLVGPTPVTITTDTSGTITIVEACNDLNASIITAAIPNDIVSYIIDPMDYAFDKMAALDTEDALRNASYPAQITAGGILGNPGSTPLVDSTISQDDLQTIASRMISLRDIWGNVRPPSTTPQRRLKPSHPGVVAASRHQASDGYKGIFDNIAMAAGDLFRWLKSGVEAVIDIIKDAATDAWHFIAKIAGKVYRAVLDTVEAIVGALEWVFNVIKTAIEQIIEFIKFLFSWDDIRRTKDVLHNVVRLFMRHQVGDLGNVKNLFDNQVADVEKTLSDWAGLGDWSPLGTVASTSTGAAGANPAKDQTPSSMLLANHLRDNVGQLTVRETTATTDAVQDTVDNLLHAISSEGQVLSAVYMKLQDVAMALPKMSVADAIKRIAVILGEGMLSSVQVVLDALLDALASVANTAIELLDTKIHIPVISDILAAIGVPSISFLGLFSWVAAVSVDVVYKIVYGAAPFPDNSDVDALLSASSWQELTQLFGKDAGADAASQLMAAEALTLPHELAKAVHIVGHAAAGFNIIMGNFLQAFEAEAPTGNNPFSMPGAILGVVTAVLDGAADVLVPSDPIDNAAVSALGTATTVAGVVSKIIFSGPVQGKLAASSSGFSALAVQDGRATSAIVSSILVIPSLFVTCWHFYELSQKPDGTQRSAAILSEVSKLTSCGATISYAVAVNDQEPLSKQAAIVSMVACNVATGGLQTAEAFLIE
ncbi:hypothetical protein diail_4609 [Diaporthe ilicicola]|nr:hypothetical protein diail_4609 [Diaporthe ilicicola]